MELKEIAARFGITASEFRKVDGSILSEVFIADGTYVLRARTLGSDTLKKFDDEQHLLEVVCELVPFRFPELMPTDTGKHYLVLDKLAWTAYPLIKGDILCNWWQMEKLTEEQRHISFISLAELHRKTAGRLADIDHMDGYRYLPDIARQLARIKNQIPSNAVKRVERALVEAARAEKGFAENDFSFVHGDFHPGNFVFKDGKIIGLLDTDWIRKGSPLEDLAYTFITYLRDCRRDTFEFDENEFRKYIGWYGLPEKDIALLKEYMILAVLFDLHGFTTQTQPLPDRDHLVALQRSFLKDVCEKF